MSDSLHSYAWDVETRPTTIDTVTATYDALGRMVEQNKGGVRIRKEAQVQLTQEFSHCRPIG